MTHVGSRAAIGYPTPSNPNLPYEHELIPVVQGAEGFQQFQAEIKEKHPGIYFVPYVADKPPEEWDKSTSRIFMNQALPGCVYVPVQINGGDSEGLTAFLNLVRSDESVAAVNITQPHKGSPAVHALTGGSGSVDNLVRNKATKQLEPFDSNGPAFIEWYTSFASFEDRDVFVVGLGGAGTTIVDSIARSTEGAPKKITLIDPEDRSQLATRLNGRFPVAYHQTAEDIGEAELQGYATIINAAGDKGTKNCSHLLGIQGSNLQDKIVVDIRTHIDDGLSETAQSAGWRFFDGTGMSLVNNYYLACAIAAYMEASLPDRDNFSMLVQQAQSSQSNTMF